MMTSVSGSSCKEPVVFVLDFNEILNFPFPIKHHAGGRGGVSGDGFNGGSDSYLQFRDTCGTRRNINLILDVNP